MKIVKVLFIIFLSIAIVLVALKYSNFNLSMVGNNVYTSSISDSKEMKLFITEYYTENDLIKLQDSDHLKINKIWLEYFSTYNYFMKANIEPNQFVINIEIDSISSKLSKEYSLHWRESNDSFNQYNNGKYRTKIRLANNLQKIQDSLKIYISIYNNKYKKYDTLTSFKLIKKYD